MPDMWRRLTTPEVLIYPMCPAAASMRRRATDFSQAYLTNNSAD